MKIDPGGVTDVDAYFSPGLKLLVEIVHGETLRPVGPLELLEHVFHVVKTITREMET